MSGFKPIETQEARDRIIGERLAREKEKYSDYDGLKEKAEAYDALQERVAQLETENIDLKAAVETSGQSKSQQEARIAELEGQITGFEAEKLRTRVALEYGLPIDMAERLRGDDEDALKADAESLAGFMKPKEPQAPLKSTEPHVGTGEDAGYRSMLHQLQGE